jgi:hypothetical protein
VLYNEPLGLCPTFGAGHLILSAWLEGVGNHRAILTLAADDTRTCPKERLARQRLTA